MAQEDSKYSKAFASVSRPHARQGDGDWKSRRIDWISDPNIPEKKIARQQKAAAKKKMAADLKEYENKVHEYVSMAVDAHPAKNSRNAAPDQIIRTATSIAILERKREIGLPSVVDPGQFPSEFHIKGQRSYLDDLIERQVMMRGQRGATPASATAPLKSALEQAVARAKEEIPLPGQQSR